MIDLSYPEQRARIRDTTPAQRLGVTMMAVAESYRVPLRVVRQAFIWGLNEQGGRLGRFDHWGVHYAALSDVQKMFARKGASPDAATPPHVLAAMRRAEARRTRLRDMGVL